MKNKKIITSIIVVMVFIIGMCGFIYDRNQEKREELGVESDNELLKYFKSKYPENEVIKCGYEDLNNDGRKDLVVIFNKTERKNGMVVIIDKESDYEVSEEVPAPLENQKIEFKNIDETPPMEFIVSGSKDGKFGYAIFRLEGLKIRDLFGESMEDCC